MPWWRAILRAIWAAGRDRMADVIRWLRFRHMVVYYSDRSGVVRGARGMYGLEGRTLGVASHRRYPFCLFLRISNKLVAAPLARAAALPARTAPARARAAHNAPRRGAAPHGLLLYAFVWYAFTRAPAWRCFTPLRCCVLLRLACAFCAYRATRHHRLALRRGIKDSGTARRCSVLRIAPSPGCAPRLGIARRRWFASCVYRLPALFAAHASPLRAASRAGDRTYGFATSPSGLTWPSRQQRYRRRQRHVLRTSLVCSDRRQRYQTRRCW